MATSANHQSLLQETKKNGILSSKVFYFVLSVFAVILSVSFLVPHLFRTNRSDLSVSLSLCNRAHNPEECSRFLSEVASDAVTRKDGKTLLQKFLMNYVDHLENATVIAKVIKKQINDVNELGALTDCLELIDLSVDRVKESVIALASSTGESLTNAQTWLSGVLTNHVTCIDGLKFSQRTPLGSALEDLMARARASLAMIAEVRAPTEEILQPLRGKLPSWVTMRDRKLLESSANDIKADLVVAQDGTGDYQTVAEAVLAVPDKSEKRFVIHIKKGTYEENVEVTKKKKNLMIIGDGMNLTIITGSLNVVDGSSTFRSATLGKKPHKKFGEIHVFTRDLCYLNMFYVLKLM